MNALRYNTYFIGNRELIVDFLLDSTVNKIFSITKIFCLKNSRLENYLSIKFDNIQIEYFDKSEKDRIIEEIKKAQFDVLISNGCPFIFPIQEFPKKHKYFINVHPTYLPYLKGITGINGVFFNQMRYFGGTVHHIDEGTDTGNIISQKKIKLTSDLDLGLVYNMSFEAELLAFSDFYNKTKNSGKIPSGNKQSKEGSYFKREKWMRMLNFEIETTTEVIKKIKSFGISSQGCFLYTPKESYKVFDAEKIISKFLLNKYKNFKAGEILLHYDNKFLIRTIDGIIKISKYESINHES